MAQVQQHRQSHPLIAIHTPPQPQSRQPLPSPQEPPPQPLRRGIKRPRPVKSCTECRNRKLRCDRLCPCSQCQKSSRVCKYAAEHESNLSDLSNNEAPEPIRPLKRPCPPGAVSGFVATGNDVFYSPPRPEQAGIQILEDLLLRMGRLEKHFLRSPAGTDLYGPRIFIAPANTIRGLSIKKGMLVTRFVGQNSPRVLVNLFREAKEYLRNHHNINGAREVLSGFHQLHTALHDSYKKSFMPITVFVDSIMPVQKRMSDILPKKPVCDRLFNAYLTTSEGPYRVLHLPSFSEQYGLYWEGKIQYESFVPQLLCVLAMASRFETKSKGLNHERSDGVHIPTACALVRSWLDSLKGKQLVDVTTIQVEILLLQTQRLVTSRIEDGWTQLGYVVRAAMAVGLHRDPTEFQPRITIFVAELRRRLWYTLVELDMQISLVANLPSLVREGDFTCRPPRNLDDSELFPDMKELPPGKPIDQETDCQQQVLASLSLGMRMKAATLITTIDSLRDYTDVLDIGSKLERFLDEINDVFPRHGMLNDTHKSRVWRARVLMDMHVRRPLTALYRPLAIGAPDPPPQIFRSYLRSSVFILKYLDELDPLLSDYQDIKDMYHAAMKRDIVQAAFSVCFYIRSAAQGHPNTMSRRQPPGNSSDSHEDLYPSPAIDVLWPPSRLINEVEKTLDLLIRHANGTDMKDIVSLATVLETARVAEIREGNITNGLCVVLDRCLNMSRSNLEMALPSSSWSVPVDHFQGERYGRMPLMYDDNNTRMGCSGHGGWVLWDGSD
ncbi:fungal-specific transcription factor domain-containing protein [Stachybotrys elegans]|uniref:Fungal-specific transcription factor domain-containing protein n=1 Tax=Stachybotrys elegans TaxID=80388 RepID=A0A8K0SDR1_9HYPO|nr:fungal-specific transcription factor domain-containing protein [Stachybotrys elegans]